MKFNFKDMSEELRKIMKFNIKFKRQIELKDNKKKEVKNANKALGKLEEKLATLGTEELQISAELPSEDAKNKIEENKNHQGKLKNEIAKKKEKISALEKTYKTYEDRYLKLYSEKKSAIIDLDVKIAKLEDKLDDLRKNWSKAADKLNENYSKMRKVNKDSQEYKDLEEENEKHKETMRNNVITSETGMKLQNELENVKNMRRILENGEIIEELLKETEKETEEKVNSESGDAEKETEEKANPENADAEKDKEEKLNPENADAEKDKEEKVNPTNEDARNGKEEKGNPENADARNGKEEKVNPENADARNGKEEKVNPENADARNGKEEKVNPENTDSEKKKEEQESTNEELLWHPKLTEEQIEDAISRGIYEPKGPEYEQFLLEHGIKELNNEEKHIIEPEEIVEEGSAPKSFWTKVKEFFKEGINSFKSMFNKQKLLTEGKQEELKIDSKKVREYIEKNEKKGEALKEAEETVLNSNVKPWEQSRRGFAEGLKVEIDPAKVSQHRQNEEKGEAIKKAEAIKEEMLKGNVTPWNKSGRDIDL